MEHLFDLLLVLLFFGTYVRTENEEVAEYLQSGLIVPVELCFYLLHVLLTLIRVHALGSLSIELPVHFFSGLFVFEDGKPLLSKQDYRICSLQHLFATQQILTTQFLDSF